MRPTGATTALISDLTLLYCLLILFRLKNQESQLYKVLSGLTSHHRLLLTGTPLQNSLKELWCLLRFLQLDVVSIQTWETFQAQYGTGEERARGYTRLHSMLRPHIIRRMKRDVEKSLPPKVSQVLAKP